MAVLLLLLALVLFRPRRKSNIIVVCVRLRLPGRGTLWLACIRHISVLVIVSSPSEQRADLIRLSLIIAYLRHSRLFRVDLVCVSVSKLASLPPWIGLLHMTDTLRLVLTPLKLANVLACLIEVCLSLAKLSFEKVLARPHHLDVLVGRLLLLLCLAHLLSKLLNRLEVALLLHL